MLLHTWANPSQGHKSWIWATCIPIKLILSMFVANWTSSRCVAYEGSPTGCIYFTVGHVHRHSESWKLSRETPEGRVFVLRASKSCLLIFLLNWYCWHKPQWFVDSVSKSTDYCFKCDYLLDLMFWSLWRILQQWFFSLALESVLNFGFRHKNTSWLGSDAVPSDRHPSSCHFILFNSYLQADSGVTL